ncbi:GbsR/MarR family transcriptional regulator [Terrihalobacillus insolitus]|uniref:GbsR/MarR family transcriptional regulator n=1 Tax=Terrihalobacillus insolitus TaxID=2950438 RepID=UPI0023422677|nr:helix-turn-helix domain-containing protein [Terrihalobacillus insolitus]MDC3413763.1 transcriptional regulator [Terrihalobacillus insolitus]
MSKNQLENLNYLIVTEFAKTLELFDLSSSEARLFAVLYIENRPMKLDEMGEKVGKSKTSVSNGVRSLLDLNLVERVWKKGERKDLYQADDELYRKFMSTYIYRWLDATNRQKDSLEQIEEQLRKESLQVNNPSLNEYVDDLNDRLIGMIEFHKLIQSTFKDIKHSATSLNKNN